MTADITLGGEQSKKTCAEVTRDAIKNMATVNGVLRLSVRCFSAHRRRPELLLDNFTGEANGRIKQL